MEPKKYELPALLDLCGGAESAMRALLPLYILNDSGLWHDRQAIAGHLAPPCDHHLVYGPTPDSELIDELFRNAEESGLTWHPRKNSSEPALPLPFTSYDLAAFMLAGGGLALFERFNNATLGPGAGASLSEQRRHGEQVHFRIPSQDVEEYLSRRGCRGIPPELGENCDAAREVLDKAIGLRFIADEKFGRSDDGVRMSAHWLLNDAFNELVQNTTAVTETPAVSGENTPVLNRIKSRSNVLGAVIDQAKSQALDRNDWTSVWAALVAIATRTDRPAPLLGYTEGEGVKYQADKEETPVRFLSREAFRKRFKRSA